MPVELDTPVSPGPKLNVAKITVIQIILPEPVVRIQYALGNKDADGNFVPFNGKQPPAVEIRDMPAVVDENGNVIEPAKTDLTDLMMQAPQGATLKEAIKVACYGYLADNGIISGTVS